MCSSVSSGPFLFLLPLQCCFIHSLISNLSTKQRPILGPGGTRRHQAELSCLRANTCRTGARQRGYCPREEAQDAGWGWSQDVGKQGRRPRGGAAGAQPAFLPPRQQLPWRCSLLCFSNLPFSSGLGAPTWGSTSLQEVFPNSSISGGISNACLLFHLCQLDTFLLTVAWHQATPCHLPEATTTRVSSRPTGPTKTLLYSLLTSFTDSLRVAAGFCLYPPHLLDWQSLPTKGAVCSPHTAPHCLITGLPSCLLPDVIFSHLLIASIHATPASSFRSGVPGVPGSLSDSPCRPCCTLLLADS